MHTPPGELLQIGVAGLGDTQLLVHIAGLNAPRRQAEVRSHIRLLANRCGSSMLSTEG